MIYGGIITSDIGGIITSDIGGLITSDIWENNNQ